MPLCPSPLGAQGLACAWHAADDHIRENERPWSQAWRCHHGTLSTLPDLSAPSPASEFVVFELLKQPRVPGSPQLPPDQGCLVTLLRTGGEGLSQPRLEALGPYERRGPFMKEPHPPCHGFMFGATSPGRKKHGKWRWGLRYALPGRRKEKPTGGVKKLNMKRGWKRAIITIQSFDLHQCMKKIFIVKR